ncbi:MAG: glycosyltransferase family 4 protein [Candidatus Krumholzibacteriota bacterium]|nr:glycosyltransferase family 4 protein [Candidatus Krumholzibacteriota bacterium]
MTKQPGSLRIAMIGSKGLPAVFGGIERHVEEIGKRLVEKGHRVSVFGRKQFSIPGNYGGMELRVLPSVATKNLDTASNSLLASLKTLGGSFDIVHYHGIGPSIFCWIPALRGIKTVATIHARDYRQQKWGPTASRLLKKGERNAVRKAAATITVSRLMQQEMEEEYGRRLYYIPNGASLIDPPGLREAREIGVSSGGYILSVGRFIVERGFDTLIGAFRNIYTDLKLVIVGDERFAPEYSARLKNLADDRVIFPGYVHGRKLNELYAHCLFYVLPSLVEGLPISLLEAMSFSRPVLISDIPENLEVAGGIGRAFRRGDEEDLRRALGEMLVLDHAAREEMGRRGRERVQDEYTWDSVADQVEELYLHICK